MMGPQGLADVAYACHRNARYLREALLGVPGVESLFEGPFFHEFALRLPVAAADVVAAMMSRNILAGLVLADFTPDMPEAERGLLVAVTEKRSGDEMDAYAAALADVIGALS